MGCDIHVHVEIKLNGKWEHYSVISLERSYILFGKMAGVRSDEVEPIAQPRGLPSDMSVVTVHDAEYWGRDGHTHSWLTREEAGEVQKWYKEKFGNHAPLFGYVFSSYIRSDLGHVPEVTDVRIVLWFDN